MTYECFDVEVKDRIAHIVLSRPAKRNSMTPAFWRELPEIVREIDAAAEARVIVISSTGPHFTAGLDISHLRQGGGNGQDRPDVKAEAREAVRHGARFYDNTRHLQESFSALENCRLPVLAAIQGGCIGGGVDMVTACDMRYATEDAFVTVFEINVGITADVGTFPRLVKLIPEGIVRELAYTGRRMPALEAKEVGLVNRVFRDQETMLEGVFDIAREIAAKPPLALYGCKRMINYSRDHNTADGLDYISIWNASFLQPAEMREAVMATQEKRTGEFVDLPPLPRSAD
ncbi:MAG: crotonase/enoyl-CoA hydratase family protein [Gammaproteobacteria bacterium]|nr:crotonase/enoyl-CoA hydratase family protein [Gammaproteobacteria bacterium]